MSLFVRKGEAPQHGAVEDAEASTMEAVGLAAKTVAEGLAAGIIEVGEATPIVAPLFAALQAVKETFDGVKRHREQLEELHDHCTVITMHVIIRCNTPSSKIDIAPLKKCVADLVELVTSYSTGGLLAKVGRYRRDKDRVDKLRRDIEALVPIMGLGGVARVSEQLESMRNDIDRIADAIKVACIQSSEHKTLLVSGCSDSRMVMGIDWWGKHTLLTLFSICRVHADCFLCGKTHTLDNVHNSSSLLQM